MSEFEVVIEQPNYNSNRPDWEVPSTSVGIHPVSGDQILLVSCDQPEIKT